MSKTSTLKWLAEAASRCPLGAARAHATGPTEVGVGFVDTLFR
jgi:hypothetical protein